MKKSEFKEMIKESVKEVLIEEGVLKNVISEVVKAVGQPQQPVVTQQTFTEQASLEAAEKKKQKLAETRKRMLDAVGRDSYGGVDVFEGTTPIPSGEGRGALSGQSPGDPGVNISNLPGMRNWGSVVSKLK